MVGSKVLLFIASSLEILDVSPSELPKEKTRGHSLLVFSVVAQTHGRHSLRIGHPGPVQAHKSGCGSSPLLPFNKERGRMRPKKEPVALNSQWRNDTTHLLLTAFVIYTYILLHGCSHKWFFTFTPPPTPPCFHSCMYVSGAYAAPALARGGLFGKFAAHIGVRELSLLVMPALLVFGAERIRGLSVRRHTHTNT